MKSTIYVIKFLLSFYASTLAKESLNSNHEDLFKEYLKLNNLKFIDQEYLKRLNIFEKNMEIIENHNSLPDVTFKMGITKFSHLSNQEFSILINGGLSKAQFKSDFKNSIHKLTKPVNQLPPNVDWVSKGGVTPVKNQGSCGDCWAFSATGALEGAFFIANGYLPGNEDTSTGFYGLSEQQLTACDSLSLGCTGGWPQAGFVWAAINNGLTGEGDYPFTEGNYTAQSNVSCSLESYNSDDRVAPIPENIYTSVSSKVPDFMSAVSQQPLSIQIEASSILFQFYKSGVISNKGISPKVHCGLNLDHAVLLVGYGVQKGIDYWKVKNSWSSNWGENGYVLIERSNENVCGVLSEGFYPNVPQNNNEVHPTSSPTVNNAQLDQNQYDQYLPSLESVILLPKSGKSAENVEITNAILSGGYLGEDIPGLACRANYYNLNKDNAVWLVAGLKGSNTYISYLALYYDNGFNELLCNIPTQPFELVGFNLPLSCETVNQYWLSYSYIPSLGNSLPIAKSDTDPGFSIKSFNYIVKEPTNDEIPPEGIKYFLHISCLITIVVVPLFFIVFFSRKAFSYCCRPTTFAFNSNEYYRYQMPNTYQSVMGNEMVVPIQSEYAPATSRSYSQYTSYQSENI